MDQEMRANGAERSPETVNQRPAVAPPVDVYENGDELLLVADVPGVAAEGLSVRVEKDELIVEAKRQAREHGAVLARGLVETDYLRTFTIPRAVDGSRIAAELKNGVLRVHLPKSDATKPRRVEVKAS